MSNKGFKGNVLIVDDEKEMAKLIETVMRREGYAADVSYDGEDALAKFKEKRPDLVILDINLPKINGIAVGRKIKSEKEFVPVIFITGEYISVDDKVEGFKAGGDDYLIKPFNVAELTARVRSMFRLKQIYNKLELANRHLEELSLIDPLTGVYNRRYLMNRIEAEIRRSVRVKGVVSCIIVDVDKFKALNDSHGHSFGDAILKQMADFLKNNIRGTDIIARYGGDEFIIVAPDTDKEGASILGSKLLKKAEKAVFKNDELSVQLSISLGVSSFNGESIAEKIMAKSSVIVMSGELINNADKALYEAKEKGGNRICAS